MEETEDYMTAGELAQSVGITLRSVQYYDQQGLLPPSKHGPNNLRLYSNADQQRLYRILVLKYMGLSLAQIREMIDNVKDNDSVVALVNSRIEHINSEFHDLFQKLQALYEVRSGLLGVDNPNWQQLASIIERVQDQGSMIWHVIGTVDSTEEELTEIDKEERRDYLVSLHELVGEAMERMHANEPLTSSENRTFAKRALTFFQKFGNRFGQSTLIMGNAFQHSAHPEGFDALSGSVVDFIGSVIKANNPTTEEGSEE